MPKLGPIEPAWPASELMTAKPMCSALVSPPPPFTAPVAVPTLPSMPPLPWWKKRPFQFLGRRISKPMAYFAPSMGPTRSNIRPVTRQCSGTGWPATVRVPAVTWVAAVMVVLGKLILVTRSVHASRVAGVAGLSWGRPPSEPPQAASSKAAGTAAAMRRPGKWGRGCFGMVLSRLYVGWGITALSSLGSRCGCRGLVR